VVQTTQRRAAVLYEHPLLGEGLATRLRVEAHADVLLASVHDLRGVREALRGRPAVVVFERCERLCEQLLRELAPDAELIDVSSVVSRGLAAPRDVTGFDRILLALRPEQIPVPSDPRDDQRRG
jgi:hypothetical protein